MNLRRILVLLVLVAALGAYLFVYEIPKARQEAEKEKLLGVDRDAVVGLTLTYPDREIELRRGETGWRVVKPIDAAADETIVNSLLTTLTEAQVQRALEEPPTDLAPFGLDKPAVTVRVAVKDGPQPPVIAVGKNTPIGGRSYVKRGEDAKVHVTTASLQFGLSKQVKDVRDKTLLAFTDDDVQRVEIQPAEGPATTIVRKDKDAWTVEPGDHPADPTEVRSYLSSLRSMRAVDFADDAPADPGKYGLAAPRVSVTVTTGKEGQEATKRLLLGAETEAAGQKQVYARVDGRDTVYTLGDWATRSVAKTAAQFRDKTVLGFDPSRIGRVVLTSRGGDPVTLVRADAGWTLEGSEVAPSADTVSRFLDDLRDLRGSDIAAEPPQDLAAFGLATPEVSVALADREGAALGTVLLGKAGAKHYAMRAGAPTVLEVRDYMVTRLDKRRDDFLARADTKPTAPAADAEPEDLELEEDLEPEDQATEAEPAP